MAEFKETRRQAGIQKKDGTERSSRNVGTELPIYAA